MSENIIYCYSGAGHCLDMAKTIAKKLGDTDIVMMRSYPIKTDAREAKRVGFVFSCMAGGLPGDMEMYIRDIQIAPDAYKFAVEQYAAALRMELQLLGYRVIVIRPGAVDTGMLPASTVKLERFCTETRLYAVNAERFRRIVGRVEARKVSPDRIAAVVWRSLVVSRPRLVCAVNRNPLLLLLNTLPRRLQLWIIRKILS